MANYPDCDIEVTPEMSWQDYDPNEQALMTGKGWEDFFREKGHILHTYEGFGSDYPNPESPPSNWDTRLYTEWEFIKKTQLCLCVPEIEEG